MNKAVLGIAGDAKELALLRFCIKRKRSSFVVSVSESGNMDRLKKIDDSEIHYGPYAKYVKRPLDFIVSASALVVLSPALLALSAAVRFKLGRPVFFRQTRCGRDEQPFEMIKFRTMTDARDSDGNLLPDTERFTKFGDFLRNYSLDELPELLNVVKGDMSIVGPRPLYTFYVPYYTEEEALRHAVRGGITGLAQVNGRALCRWNERFSFDVEYVRDITLVNDLKILWRTVAKVFGKSDIGIPSVTDEGGLHIVREIQRLDRVSEIGSSFEGALSSNTRGDYPAWLPKNRPSNVVYLSTGRSCIREILGSLDCSRKLAVVPEFTCASVVEPFVDAGYKVYPYHINYDLTVDLDAFAALIEEMHPSVVLIHRYFGFDTCGGVAEILQGHNEITAIEDETHCMFSSGHSIYADYRIGSIRKWGPFPDGAYLASSNDSIQQPVIDDEKFIEIQVAAMEQKRRHLEGSNPTQDYLDLFAQGRDYADCQKETFSMSRKSRRLLDSVDIASMIETRRENARVLIDSLQGFSWLECVFQNLEEGVTPFMVPIMVHEDRPKFQKYLASQKIYATVIWACPKDIEGAIGSAGRRIYDEILCLPCDQRYTAEDMRRIVSAINHYDRQLGSE